MEQFSEELKREYFNALYNQQNGNNEPMKAFRLSHFELYSTVNAMYHKRKVLRENIECMKSLSSGAVCFGALTYDNEHDLATEENKRRQATRYLDKCFKLYLFVEEYGDDKNRYHIHYIGILKRNLTYLEFLNGWHSRAQIEKVISTKRAINYLTDYVVKQVPRIRRNKRLIKTFNDYKKSLKWSNLGFEGFADDCAFSALLSSQGF